MRAASLVVLVTIVLPLVLGQFWAYQLGLYGLYAVAAVGVGLCWGQAGFLPLGKGYSLVFRRISLVWRSLPFRIIS